MHISFQRQLRAIRSRKRGTNLVELSMTVSVMAIISTAVFAILISTLSSYRKLDNETNTVQVVRNAIERIGEDVRMARSLGDVYGTTDHTVFPSSNNPISYTWPTWADGSSPTTFTLSGDTLIIQIPIFDSSTGFPSFVTDVEGNNEANVETHIYRVLHRTTDPADEYVLQYACFPGNNIAGSYDAASAKRDPSIIATGIIGPKMSGHTTPRVFQYITMAQKDATTLLFVPQTVVDDTFPTPSNIADFTTVAINLEVRKHDATSQLASKWKDAGVWAVKQEVYMRNNAYATVSNSTSN